jgi:hypothetical protein
MGMENLPDGVWGGSNETPWLQRPEQNPAWDPGCARSSLRIPAVVLHPASPPTLPFLLTTLVSPMGLQVPSEGR